MRKIQSSTSFGRPVRNSQELGAQLLQIPFPTLRAEASQHQVGREDGLKSMETFTTCGIIKYESSIGLSIKYFKTLRLSSWRRLQLYHRPRSSFSLPVFLSFFPTGRKRASRSPTEQLSTLGFLTAVGLRLEGESVTVSSDIVRGCISVDAADDRCVSASVGRTMRSRTAACAWPACHGFNVAERPL